MGSLVMAGTGSTDLVSQSGVGSLPIILVRSWKFQKCKFLFLEITIANFCSSKLLGIKFSNFLVVDAAEVEAVPLEPDEDRPRLGRPPPRDLRRPLLRQSGSRVRLETSDVIVIYYEVITDDESIIHNLLWRGAMV